MSVISKSKVMLVGLAAAATCATTFAAHRDSASNTQAQVQAALDRVQAALARGDDASTVTHMLYANNVVIVGEGDAQASHGIDAAVEDVKEWADSLGPGGEKTCKFKLADPAVVSSRTFSSFVLLHCDANPPKLPQAQVLRMMYIWQKLPQGWRVQLEMWAPGKF